MENVRIRIRRVAPDAWEATGSIRLDAGASAPPAHASVTARAGSKADAAARTLRALDAVSRSPLVRSMMPPGAGAALEAARSVASSVARLLRRRRARPSVSGPPPHAIVHRAMRAAASRGLAPGIARLGAELAR